MKEGAKSRCDGCRFWVVTEGAVQQRVTRKQDPESDDPEKFIELHTELKLGECRRSPPVQMYDQLKALQGKASTSALDTRGGIPAWMIQYVRTSSWPVTMEAHGCGDFKTSKRGWLDAFGSVFTGW